MPSEPLDSIRVTLMWTTEVETVEIGMMTMFVPPGAFVLHRTVRALSIIVIVKRRESEAIVNSQRISYKFMTTYSHTHHTLKSSDTSTVVLWSSVIVSSLSEQETRAVARKTARCLFYQLF